MSTRPKTSTCSSCGAAIIWVQNNGKSMPLNSMRVRTYEIADTQGFDGSTIAMTVIDSAGDPALRYVSHFTTCPYATQHSKGRKPV